MTKMELMEKAEELEIKMRKVDGVMLSISLSMDCGWNAERLHYALIEVSETLRSITEEMIEFSNTMTKIKEVS